MKSRGPYWLAKTSKWIRRFKLVEGAKKDFLELGTSILTNF
jgi:hypothetical protein